MAAEARRAPAGARAKQKQLEALTAREARAFLPQLAAINAAAAQAIREAIEVGPDGVPRWKPQQARKLKRWLLLLLLLVGEVTEQRLKAAARAAQALAADHVADSTGLQVMPARPPAIEEKLKSAANRFAESVTAAMSKLVAAVLAGAAVVESLATKKAPKPDASAEDVVSGLIDELEAEREWKARREIRTTAALVYADEVLEETRVAAKQQPGLRRIWISCTRPDVCRWCADIDGQVVGVNEPFVWDLGEVMSGGLHPNCHCLQLPYIGP